MLSKSHRFRSRANAQAQHRSAQTRAVRACVHETSWLDGRLRWNVGRVVWQDARGLMAPDAQDLALAQQHIDQAAQYTIAARRVVDDPEAWLARRRAQLQLARQLATINAPDLPALVQPVHLRHPQVVRRLVSLLPAEALCLEGLPASPAAALLACGARARDALVTLRDNGRAPLAGRALAALVLGAIDKQATHEAPADWVGRAYAWGCYAGVPPDPALVVTLLADVDGIALARRCVQALHTTSPLRLPTELLHALAAEIAPATLVALAEAAAASEPLVARIIQRRAALPPDASRPRRALAERLLQQRQQVVADLAALTTDYVRVTRNPATLTCITQFTYATLDLGSLTLELADVLISTLRAGLALQASLAQPYLDLLVAYHARLFDRSDLHPGASPLDFAAWLDARRRDYVLPLVQILSDTRQVARACTWLDSADAVPLAAHLDHR